MCVEGVRVGGGCCKEITVYYGSLAKRSKGLSKAKQNKAKRTKIKAKSATKAESGVSQNEGGGRVEVERKRALPGVANGILDGWECT